MNFTARGTITKVFEETQTEGPNGKGFKRKFCFETTDLNDMLMPMKTWTWEAYAYNDNSRKVAALVGDKVSLDLKLLSFPSNNQQSTSLYRMSLALREIKKVND